MALSGIIDDERLDAIVQAIQDDEIDLVLSRDREVLEACVENTVTYFSTLEPAEAALETINSDDQPLSVQDVKTRPKTQREWGQ